MSTSKSPWWSSPPLGARYAVALISVAMAVLLALALEHYWHSTPFVSLFLCAIMVSAWFGGLRPGLLAIILSVLAFDYFFLLPLNSLAVNLSELPRLVLFVISATLVGLLSAAQRGAAESVRCARDRLAEKNQELNSANEALHAENIERKLAEAALRRNEAHMLAAQALSHTGNTGFRVSDRKIFWSEESARIYGYDPAIAPTAEMMLQRVHPEDIVLVKNALDRAVLGGQHFDFEHRLLMPDGSIKHLHSVAHSVRDEAGHEEILGAIMDITERKQTQDALNKAQAELAHISRMTTMGELAASIAHEVNQPLTAVVNNANACLSLLPNGAPNFEEVREALVEIIEDADRASTVITRVRQLARKAPFERTLLNPKDLITDVLALARYEAATRQVTIRTELAADLPCVLGDRVQLQQVLLNLVVNGMDAMGAVEAPNRILTICGRREARDGSTATLLIVRDAGTGFKPEEMDRLFEAFFTTKPQGTGLGLAISRSIIEAHGGRLWAEPNQGPGATFLISLPEAGHAAS